MKTTFFDKSAPRERIYHHRHAAETAKQKRIKNISNESTTRVKTGRPGAAVGAKEVHTKSKENTAHCARTHQKNDGRKGPSTLGMMRGRKKTKGKEKKKVRCRYYTVDKGRPPSDPGCRPHSRRHKREEEAAALLLSFSLFCIAMLVFGTAEKREEESRRLD